MSELWQRLQTAGLVEGDEPAPDEPHWSSRLLLGVSGWLAALFILFFLFMGLGSQVNNPASAIVLGALLIAAARLLLLARHYRVLLEQCALALVLAGDGWLLYGMLDHAAIHSVWLWAGLGVIALLIAFIFPHWLLRLFHSAGAAMLFAFALACLGLQLLALPLVLLALLALIVSEARFIQRSALIESLLLGLGLATLALGLFELRHDALFDLLGWFGASRLPAQLGPLLTLPLWVLALRQLVIPWRPALPLMVASALIPGVGAGSLLLVMGAYSGRRSLWSLGLLCLLGYGAAYYYQLELSLLHKSLLLLGCGALLLGAGLWLQKRRGA